jgi:large subunit ribosomal protein L24e
MATTIKAMKRVQEVRAKRERAFTVTRLQPKQEAERALATVQLEKNVALAAVGPKKKTETMRVAMVPASKKMELD